MVWPWSDFRFGMLCFEGLDQAVHHIPVSEKRLASTGDVVKRDGTGRLPGSADGALVNSQRLLEHPETHPRRRRA
jgi:hypothetical protein